MKKQMIAGAIAGVCLVALVGCSGYTISMNQKMYSQMTNLQNQMEKMKTEAEDKEKEKPVDESELTIGEHYHILDNSAISDAYKSGNADNLEEQDKETLQMAKEVLESIMKDGMTPFEKEDAVYQWMCKNIKYDDGSMSAIPTAGEYCDRPYGVLKNKRAVCVGYATTFRLFMEMLDIPCKVVHDTELSHSWDLIKLDDDWYHVDLTFDNNDGSGGSYRNFNMSDTIAQRNGHEWEQSDYPAANGYTYLMANQKKEKIKDEMAVIDKVKEMTDKKKTYAFLEFENEINEDFLSTMISMIQERLGENSSVEYNFVPISEEKSVFAVYMIYFNNGNDLGNRNVDEKEYAKMMEKIDKLFGPAPVYNGGDDDYLN